MSDIVGFTIDELNMILKEEEWDQIVVGFSGGKDSTCVVQVLIDCIVKNKIDIPIKILSSDTLIENPLISEQIKIMHTQINNIARNYNLDIETKLIYPKITDSYLYNTIVKGYATPLNSRGRWCTRALKVDPMKQYYDNLSVKTLLLTGVRLDESSSRKRNIENLLEGKNIVEVRKNLFSYPLIKDWSLSDVWDYVQDVTRSDGYYLNTSSLWELYRDATTDDVCPSSVDMSVGNSQKGCGKSRYGCYLCPLVKRDTTLEANIINGHEELVGFLELRDFYIERCYDPKYRDRVDRRNKVRFKEVTHNLETNIISFTLLNTRYKGYPDNFHVIEVGSLEEAEHIILENTQLNETPIPNCIFDHEELELLFKCGEKYFAVTTGRLSFTFRKSLLNKIIEIEEQYSIQFMSSFEKQKIMKDFKQVETEGDEGYGNLYNL